MARQLFARVNDAEQEIVLEREHPHAPWRIAGKAMGDVVRTGPNEFSVVADGRSHRALVVKEDKEQGTVRLRIDGKEYAVKIEDEQSRLMKTLGITRVAPVVREIKAPMPGLVINVLVKPGDAVKKNDPVLVLEAMKMENVIKSPGDGVVSAVHIEQGRAVEKGELLVSFD